MEKIIMVKYGELTTKKDNRNLFIRTLENNIESVLKGIDYTIIKDYYRMFIKTKEIEKCVNLIKKVFGIYEVCICYFSTDKSIENIYNLATYLIKENTTFKVETNRSDKTYDIKSMEVSRLVGSYILKNVKNVKVDVHNPEVLINVEIRKEGIYLYIENIKCLGGYPLGSLGSATLLLSGGIDSVVAGYLTMKRGVKLDFLYFESLPHTSIEARNKVESLAKILKEYGNTGNLYVVNFTKIQEFIYKNLDNTYMITIMRRMMYRIATEFSIKHNNNAIINGESIGQVASQTLTSMKAVNEVTTFPVIRPLASFDKLDIIKIAKEIGSYEISILPYMDCCTVFVPPHPIINPSIPHIHKEEEKFDFTLIEEALNNIIKIDLIDETSDLL